MKRITLSSAIRPLAEYIEELDEDALVLTKRRRPVAAVIPLKNVDRESLALSCSPQFLRIVAEARARFAAGRKLSLDEVKRAFLPKPASKARKRPATLRAR